MRTENLLKRLQRMPMLKAIVPFAAGIALAEHFTLPLWFLAGAFVCSGLMALLLRSSAATLALLLTAGFGAAQIRQSEPTVPRNIHTIFEIAIEGIPSDRGKYTSAEGVVTVWRDPATGCWQPARDRILIRADSLTPLKGGEKIRCRGTIRPFRGGSESYRALMVRRGYAGTLNLSQRTLLERLPGRENGLHLTAARRLTQLDVPGDAGAVLRAMTSGDRSGITPELRSVYSRSGLSHLLAVSGLHTGIVFLLINLALWWLPLIRRGHLIRNLAVIACLWIYVAAAGFPPSAIRAAVMCTLLQTALASGSEYLALNSLATAAFGMLLYNPAWIGDISFQLSFAAVAGILAWGVPLCRTLHTRYRVLNIATDAFAISLAATAATAPLVSHTFGIVPLAGILINPAAIALATVVVFSGALWLVLPLGLLAPPIRFAATCAAEGIGWLGQAAATVPGGVVEYTLPFAPTAGIYLFFVVATAAAWCRETKKSVHLPA